MNIIIMLLGVVLVYFIIVRIYRKYWSKGLSADVSFEKNHGVCGDEVKLVEILINEKKLPLPIINLKFAVNKNILFKETDTNSNVSDKTYRNDVFSLLSNQKITRRVPVTLNKRGVFRLENVELVFSGIFMNEINVMKLKNNTEITVFPNPIQLDIVKDNTNVLVGELEKRKYLYEDKFIFKGIRDYQSYDNMKDINWKATAKTGILSVNDFNESTSRNVCILLNLESDSAISYDAVSEAAISLAAGFAEGFIEKGVNVALICNGMDIDSGEIMMVNYGVGHNHLNTINTALARIDLSKNFEDFISITNNLNNDFDKNYDVNTIYLVISSNTREQLQNSILELANKQDEILWIVPSLSNAKNENKNSRIKSIAYEVRL